MEENIEKYINNIKDIKLSDVDNEFIKYLTLFKERFGRNAYISEPNGTKEHQYPGQLPLQSSPPVQSL